MMMNLLKLLLKMNKKYFYFLKKIIYNDILVFDK